VIAAARRRWAADPGFFAFALAVVAVYIGLTAVAAVVSGVKPDRMMILAERVVQGRLDDPSFAGTVDSVTLAGRSYVAVGPLQMIPYLAFVPFGALQPIAGYVIGVVIGMAAALLSLPLVRAYGATGRDAIWLATFTAFGTLLLYVSVEGDMYYLAQAESFLFLEVFLFEWAGRRRPEILGTALGLSCLARPTTILAAVPFGLLLLWQSRNRMIAAIRMGVPIAVAVAGHALFNWARFGSPLESGYGISLLVSHELQARRARGLFSIHHLPDNLRLALIALPGLIARFPYIWPSKFGLSMALVSPGLITGVRAGFRSSERLVLWAAVVVVAIPVFLYYGGGVVQYGFRYSLDFTPFLVVLMAIGARAGLGRVDRALFIASIVSVVFGTLWRAHVFGPY
jgi:hypothetical protein